MYRQTRWWVEVHLLQCRKNRSKVGEHGAWIGTWDYYVVAIPETWLKQGPEWLLAIPGYRCFSKSREGGKRGGGVTLLIKDSLTAAERHFEGDLSTEVIWIDVGNRKTSDPCRNRDVEEESAKHIMYRCGGHRVVIMDTLQFP